MAVADIRPALREFLLSISEISALVGGERIFPVVLQQGVRDPSIVYTRISGQGDHHMQGASGLARPRVQIDAYAPTPDEAAQLADTVKFYLDGYSGPMGNVTVQGVFFDTEREDYQADVDLHRVSRDYIVHYEER